MEAQQLFLVFVLIAVAIALATALGGQIYNATNLYSVSANETIVADCERDMTTPLTATTDHYPVHEDTQIFYWKYNTSPGYNQPLVEGTNYTFTDSTGAISITDIGSHNSSGCTIVGTYNYEVGYIDDSNSRTFTLLLPLMFAVVIIVAVIGYFRKK